MSPTSSSVTFSRLKMPASMKTALVMALMLIAVLSLLMMFLVPGPIDRVVYPVASPICFTLAVGFLAVIAHLPSEKQSSGENWERKGEVTPASRRPAL
jgi:uncharacterized membrane protein YhhN